MTSEIIQVDAFTNRPFAGNPAAVALLDGFDGDHFLQQLALEMNLSETAFPSVRSDGDWDLRWFTPAAEVDLCGHATLATAHVLFDRRIVSGDNVRFHTRSGVLTCRKTTEGIVMDFPSSPAEPIEEIPRLAEMLGAEIVAVGRSFDLLVELSSAEEVAALDPDITALASIDTRAVVVTAPGDIDGGAADFVSRVFGPRVGIPEDPVTGSAHCISGPWWSERLGKTELSAHQVSARGGRLGVRLVGDRVELTGQAVTVFEGHLLHR